MYLGNGRIEMTTFNIVRFRVKPGYEQAFVDVHRDLRPAFEGFLGGNLIRTGNQTFCMIGEWENFTNLETARPGLIAFLDGFRHMLEDLGGELGVTDPVSGQSVASLALPKVAKKKAAAAGGKRAPKKAKKAAATPSKPKRKKATKKAGKRRAARKVR